jgi:antitoxin HicB
VLKLAPSIHRLVARLPSTILMTSGSVVSPRAIAASSLGRPESFAATRLKARSVAGGEMCCERKNNHLSACARPAASEGHFVQAADCLAEAIAGRIARGDDIPPPSKPKRGQHLISVPLYLAPKLALYLAMRERRIPNTELAKRLGVSETVVRRMLNPKHDTKPEKIQAALVTLGKRIVVTFEDAA